MQCMEERFSLQLSHITDGMKHLTVQRVMDSIEKVKTIELDNKVEELDKKE